MISLQCLAITFALASLLSIPLAFPKMLERRRVSNNPPPVSGEIVVQSESA